MLEKHVIYFLELFKGILLQNNVTYAIIKFRFIKKITDERISPNKVIGTFTILKKKSLLILILLSPTRQQKVKLQTAVSGVE